VGCVRGFPLQRCSYQFVGQVRMPLGIAADSDLTERMTGGL